MTEIPVIRGWATKQPHLPLEEPEPYRFDKIFQPHRKSPNPEHLVNATDIMYHGIEVIDQQIDTRRDTPYDLENKGERSTSEQVKVDAFFRPPLRRQWEDESLTRIPAKILHINGYTNPGTYLGSEGVRNDRNPESKIKLKRHQHTANRTWYKTSRPGIRIDDVNDQQTNIIGWIQDTLKGVTKEKAGFEPKVHKNMGPTRFHIFNDKNQVTPIVDVSKDPHLMLYGRVQEEGTKLVIKQPMIRTTAKNERAKLRFRAQEEGTVLDRKMDSKWKLQYNHVKVNDPVKHYDVQDAGYARYVPILGPKNEVSKNVPTPIDSLTDELIPVFHGKRANVDNQGNFGLDGASYRALDDDVIMPSVTGVRDYY